MSALSQRVETLARLAETRQRAVERLSVELAQQRETQLRFQRTLAQLANLTEGAGASAKWSNPVLAGACAQYKLTLMSLADEHGKDLAQHEAGMERTRAALLDATRRKEVVEHLRGEAQAAIAVAAARREQKAQDEVASQAWQGRFDG